MQRYPRLEVSLYIVLSRSFSKILDVTGKRLIGLYEVTSVGFFPGFGIMMIFACFRGTSQYSSLVIALNICIGDFLDLPTAFPVSYVL